MTALNLKDQLVFYGSYHHNKWNQLIHFIFVPTILWCFCVWLAYTGSLFDLSVYWPYPGVLDSVVRAAQVNGAFVLFVTYAVFYILLEVFAGITWTVFVGLPLWLFATWFVQHVACAWAWVIPLFVLSWFMQIYPGHTLLEKRKPALMDSLVQAFATAPYFVWFELLFLLGYRNALYNEVQKEVEEELARLKRGTQPLLTPKEQEGATD